MLEVSLTNDLSLYLVTYIVSGELTHQDTLGTAESLGRGSIQFMTAGRGIRHSEFNHGDKPLRFIQTWIKPSRSGLVPNYGSCSNKEAKNGKQLNELQHLVSNAEDDSTTTPVEVNQDVDAFAAELELNKSVSHPFPEGRQGYLLCIEGELSVNGEKLSKYDACEIQGGGTLDVEATNVEETENGKLAHFLMFTMKQVAGSGRTDI